MKLKLHHFFLVTGFLLLPWVVSADTSLSAFVEYTGEGSLDQAGHSVITGDVNNDGYDDLIIGARYNDDGGTNTGAVYLVYGQSSTLSSSSLSTKIEFTGEAANDQAGYSVATGDVNGDDYDDIIVGATQNNDGASDAGALYVIYGQSSILSSGSLSSYLQFRGEIADDNAGYALATGDVNNDGYDDILAGVPNRDDGVSANIGSMYLIYGQANLSAGSLSSQVRFVGEAASDQAGHSVASGDVNGDGYDDMIIGAIGNDDGGSGAGAMYLIYGKASNFSSGLLSTRVEFTGEAASDQAGYSVATGDINNDGYDDMLTGAITNDDGGSGAGAIYLIYGKASNFSSGTLYTRTQFVGENFYDNDLAGSAVATGDINSDGYDDILVGAPGNDDSHPDSGTFGSANPGAIYLIYGKTDNWSSVPLSTFTEFTGEGEDGDSAGSALAIGDTNNDQYDDAIISAPYNADGADQAGAAYLGYLYIDADGDGATSISGILAIGSDCNDADAAVSADQTYYQDADGDGLGSDTTTTICSATAPSHYVSNSNDANDSDYDNDGISTSSDCDDRDSTVSATQTYYQDADGDGLGSDVTVSVCTLTTPTGYVTNSNDQNDASYDSGYDYDSDGVASTDDCDDTDNTVSSTQTYYRDADGDGYGTSTTTISICSITAPTGYVSNSTDTSDSDYDNDGSVTSADCDDTNSALAASQTYYQDADGDGLGNLAVTSATCSLTPPTGYVINSSDTDDTTASGDSDNDDDGVNVDSDCNDADATVSEYQTYYQDADGDGYGNPDLSTSVCSATAPTGYVDNALDTDDTDSTVTYVDISSVAGTSDGNIIVTYEDDTSTQYDVFTITTTKSTIASVVPDTTVIVAVHPKARKIALVDGLTGEVYNTKTLNGTAHSKVKLLVKDLRSDDKYEAVVVAKRGSKTVHVDLFSIKTGQHKLKQRAAVHMREKTIIPSKTKLKTKKLMLRSQKNKTVVEYKVSKAYWLKQVQ